MNFTSSSCSPRSIFPSKKRIIAIGDIHGDFNKLEECLLLSKVIDASWNWIAKPKDTFIIQLGDQLDGGGRNVVSKIGNSIRHAQNKHNKTNEIKRDTNEKEEEKILLYLERLNKKAKVYGGRVLSLLGNHELMNVMGNFSYVNNNDKSFGSLKNRKNIFQPGGKLAHYMACTRNVIIQVGDILFLHAGILPPTSYNSYQSMNPEVRKLKITKVNTLMRRFLLGDTKLEKSNQFKQLFLNSDSMLWTRQLGQYNVDCSNVERTLKYWDVKGLVIGHTPQSRINSVCSNKVWRVDIGMSKAFGENNKIQVLEILDNGEELSSNQFTPFRILKK